MNEVSCEARDESLDLASETLRSFVQRIEDSAQGFIGEIFRVTAAFGGESPDQFLSATKQFFTGDYRVVVKEAE